MLYVYLEKNHFSKLQYMGQFISWTDMD